MVDDTPTDPNQTIELDFTFLADTTGQSGAAHTDIIQAKINTGTIAGGVGDGPSGTDAGMINTNGNEVATLTHEAFVGTPFTAGAVLTGTVQIAGLEAGEEVILRIDTRLGCIPERPTGNLQADISDARVTSPALDTISVGKQTVPFKQFGFLPFAIVTIIKDAIPDSSDSFRLHDLASNR